MKIVLGLTIAQIFLGPKAQRGKYTVKFNVLNLNDIPQGNIYESYNEERDALAQSCLYVLHHIIPDILDRGAGFIAAGVSLYIKRSYSNKSFLRPKCWKALAVT